jgi:KGK domain
MNDRSKQIIPDLQAVARCLDPEMLEILDSHSTLIINDLLEKLKQPIDPTLSKHKTNLIYDKSRTLGNYGSGNFFNDLKEAITQDTNTPTIVNKLIDGTTCNLLQPDGKGWQKGKLKICFEFIPEEPEPISTQDRSAENRNSPLDEIRQLANELASVRSTEQN